MTQLGQTPAQTVGPFFHYALMEDGVDDLDPHGVAGTPLLIVGTVRDGAGDLVADAMVELWQPDGDGRFRHPTDHRAGEVAETFLGFGRVATDDAGAYRVRTVLPGPVPGRDGATQAPHLNVHVFARGLLDKLATRIYFEGAAGNDHDPVLRSVPDARRGALLARRDGTEGDLPRYRFDIVLQGEDETVFFEA